MRRLFLFIAFLAPVIASAQRGKKNGPSEKEVRASLIRNAEVATTTGDLDSAHAYYSKALWMWPDEDTRYARATVNLLRKDTAGYCADVPLHGPEHEAEDAMYGKHCYRKDSVAFENSGLMASSFPGIKSVRREFWRAEGRTSHRMYDAHDSVVAIISTTPQDTLFLQCEVGPSFPDGETALYKYLGMTVRYPGYAMDAGIQGRVFLSFTVGADGAISNTRIMRGVHHTLDSEGLRVVQSMPKWTPAMHNGVSVPFRYNLPIKFTLR